MATPTKDLHDAVWRFDEKDSAKGIRALTKALAAGGDPMAKDVNGRPIAFMAASKQSPLVLAFLLDNGLAIDVQCADGTLLHRAASFGCVETVNMLLARGMAVDTRDQAGRTPLDAAQAWKHGKDAVPLLTKLTKAVQKAQGGRKPEPDGDLHRADVTAALTTLTKTDPMLRHLTQKDLKALVAAFFLELDPRVTPTFLKLMAEQDNEPLIAAGLLLAKVSRAKPTTLKLKKLDDALFHVGDVEIGGDANARLLVATGNIRVKGKLTNYEGCVVAAGGSVDAAAIWSEGPLVVLGNLTATKAIVGSYNEYGIRVGGTVKAPILALDNHSFSANKVQARRYDSFAKVPAKDRAALIKALGPIGAFKKS
ncbi:hypothetical protein BH11MYX2_BH11MYX2_00330 [soil metagenome]